MKHVSLHQLTKIVDATNHRMRCWVSWFCTMLCNGQKEKMSIILADLESLPICRCTFLITVQSLCSFQRQLLLKIKKGPQI